MKILTFFLGLGAVGLLCGFQGCLNENVARQTMSGSSTLADYVDTRSGTGGILWTSGFGTPAASVPSGLVKLGPDTTTLGNLTSTSGYHYGDTELVGFSHTRMQGTGAYDGGILRVIPTLGALDYRALRKYFMFFSHSSEVATPGYYAVTARNEIKTELTATDRVGMHRYTFPARRGHLVLELTSHFSKGGTDNVVNLTVDLPSNKVTGSLLLLDAFSARYEGLETYFVLVPNSPILSHRIITARGESADLALSGNDGPTYLDLEFDSATPVELKVGISHVDLAGAAANLDREVDTPAKTFDQVRADARARWEDTLSRVEVTGGTETQKKNFYQNLYRSFQMPTVFSDSPAPGGARNYRGFDRQVHSATFNYYTELSIWDQFRTLFPLYNLVAPDVQTDVVNSLLLMGDQSGALPRWAGGEGHTSSMLGQPANIVIAESYLKGIPGFDAHHAFDLVYAQANENVEGNYNKECLKEYATLGYCPSDVNDSVSYTLEYAYSDNAAGRFAEKLGRSESTALLARSQNYRNLWDPARRAFVPRDRQGNFEKNYSLEDNSYFGLTRAARGYREGSPNQYRWYVPHDPEGLISLFGAEFLPQLETFFQKQPQVPGSVYPNSYYWAGNEPDIQSFVLFTSAGRPDLTQRWGRWLLDKKYRTTSDALEGNDDGGTLSAWYVLVAGGLFPVAGTTRYFLTSPIFSTVTFHRGPAGTSPEVVISTTADPATHPYVCGAKLAGVPLANPWIEHADLAGGTTLEFSMGTEPCPWKEN